MWVATSHRLRSWPDNKKRENTLSASTHPSVLPDGCNVTDQWPSAPVIVPFQLRWTVHSQTVSHGEPFLPWVAFVKSFGHSNEKSSWWWRPLGRVDRKFQGLQRFLGIYVPTSVIIMAQRLAHQQEHSSTPHSFLCLFVTCSCLCLAALLLTGFCSSPGPFSVWRVGCSFGFELAILFTLPYIEWPPAWIDLFESSFSFLILKL